MVENVSTGGGTPRSFGIDPSGRFLLAANQEWGGVVVFRIDPASGRLMPTGDVIKIDKPVSVVFVPVSG
jgi:6-phosphogluconolactonase